MLESVNPNDGKKYITVKEAAERGDALRAKELREFQDSILSIALFTNHPALKDIDVRALTQEDKDFFQRENITLKQIEDQERVLLDMSQVEMAENIMAKIQEGKPVRGVTGEDLALFSRIATKKLTKEDIERQKASLMEKKALVINSLKLLEYLKATLYPQRIH